MIKVVLLGGGNVAFHIAKAILNSRELNLLQVYNRSLKSIEHLKEYTHVTNNIDKLKDADIYIISVSDSAIEKVSKRITNKNGIIVHTSGSVTIEKLSLHKNYGVFYPLQTFSKQRNLDFKTIPICLEANTKKNMETLHVLAKLLSEKIYYIDSQQREQIHTAAVFVNNFVNHLYYISNEITKQHNVNPDILQALIKETTEKALEISPYNAQTGPARRGDSNTIEKHLKTLTGNHKEIYGLLSKSIAETYGQKL